MLLLKRNFVVCIECLQANSEDDAGFGDEEDDIMGPPSPASLPSLQVVIDDVPDEYGEEVDEPPPTRRFGRRR